MEALHLLPSALLCVVGGSCLALVVLAWLHRSTPGAIGLAGLNAAIAVWSLAYAVQFVLPGKAVKLFCTGIGYIGVVSTPLAWLLFAACYSRRDRWLNRGSLLTLAALPALTLTLAWSNGYHWLLWREINLVTTPRFSTLAMSYGPWFWVHTAYSYVLLLSGTVLLLSAPPRANQQHRRQSVALVVAVLAPWLGNLLYVLRLSPIFPIDLTPFAFGLSAALFSWGMLRLRMLDVLPVAYSNVIDSLGDGVVVLDAFNRTVSINLVAARILGLPTLAAVGRPARQTLEILPAVVAQAERRASANLEMSHVIDGQLHDFEVSVTRLVTGRDRFAGMLVLLRDVTTQHQRIYRQRFLAEATALLASSLELAPTLATITRLSVPGLADFCAIHLVGPDGTLQRATLAGIDPERQTLIQELDDTYPSPLDALFGYTYVVRSGQPYLDSEVDTTRIVSQKPDEHLRRLLQVLGIHSVLSVPLVVRGPILGALTLVRAETAQLYTPEDLELALDLARRAALAVEHARLVAALHASEARARAANSSAEAANQAKFMFLAHASHELRTPLTGVIGLTAVLVKTELDPWQRQISGMLRSSANSLMAVVNNILDLSKIESGKLEVQSVPLDLGACIEEALDLVAIQAEDKKLDLSYVIAPGTPAVVASDHTLLRKILVNLLSNAIKFTPRGSVSVIVTSAPAASGYGGARELSQIHFAVHDTGIGIAPEGQERLFQAFNQIETGTGQHQVGTGLGLALSKQLCELMGGTISVRSEVGRGSCFHFSVRAQPLPEQAPAVPLVPQAALAGRTMLVIAPPLPSRDALVVQAHAWGMQTRTVAPEELAKTTFDAGETYDLVIRLLATGTGVRHAWADLPRAATGVAGARQIILLPLSFGASSQHVQDERTLLLPLPLKYSQLYSALEQLFPHAPHRLVAQEQAVAPAQTPGQQLRILLAEDDDVNQLVLIHQLEQLGLHSEVVTNGMQALNALARAPYDLALLDVQMPGLDGLAVAARLGQQRAPWNRPYLVAMTAYSTVEQREHFLASGMDDYLSKPVTQEALMALRSRAIIWLQTHRAAARRPVVDLARLKAILQGEGSEIAMTLIGTYLKHAPALLASLRTSADRADAQGMRTALHRLKSSSAAITAEQLSQLCAELELLIDSGVPEHWLPEVQHIEDAYAQVEQALQQALAATQTPSV